MKRETIFSPCRQYRYTLWREWRSPMVCDSCAPYILGESPDMVECKQCENSQKYAMFIGLNPSTADETQDDPTIRRCTGFAKAWGYGALCMTNIFAFRATDPRVMKQQKEPVGEDNQRHIVECASNAGIVVAAWGTHGVFKNQDFNVRLWIASINTPIFHLGLSKEGHPKHPLYLKADTKPMPFNEPLRKAIN